jgi:hypothetical protein
MGSRKAAPRLREAVPRSARRQPSEAEKFSGALAVLDDFRRDKLLEAVAVTARELLNSSDLNVSLPKVAERIGAATGVDRVHIFLIDDAGLPEFGRRRQPGHDPHEMLQDLPLRPLAAV